MTGWCTDRTVLALDGDKWKTRPNDDYERKGGNGFGINGGGVHVHPEHRGQAHRGDMRRRT